MEVLFKLDEGAILPRQATEGSSGYDLHALLDEPIHIKPYEKATIDTGVHVAMPYGLEAQIRSRSGLSTKQELILLNGIGTGDSDYIGSLKVTLKNLSDQIVTIDPNDRIAQLVFVKVEHPTQSIVSELPVTVRGEGGFGHTGKQ